MSHHHQQQPPPHARRPCHQIYVSNIPPFVDEEEFSKHFVQLDGCLGCRIRQDLRTKKMVGFVDFESSDAASAARAIYNGWQGWSSQGLSIQVARAEKRQAAPPQDPRRPAAAAAATEEQPSFPPRGSTAAIPGLKPQPPQQIQQHQQVMVMSSSHSLNPNLPSNNGNGNHLAIRQLQQTVHHQQVSQSQQPPSPQQPIQYIQNGNNLEILQPMIPLQQQQQQQPSPLVQVGGTQLQQQLQQLQQAQVQQQQVFLPSPLNVPSASITHSSAAAATTVLKPYASKTLFIRNLPSDVEEREAAHIFRPYPGFVSVRIVQKRSTRDAHAMVMLCFAEFKTPQDAAACMNQLNGYILDLNDEDSPKMKIDFARTNKNSSDSRSSRRNNLSNSRTSRGGARKRHRG